jgi:ribonucleotide monophosphatase NagD (HAD superfamily)
VGVAAGSIAALLEHALDQRFPEAGLRFEALAKPYAPIFDEACKRAGTRDAVMVGDQLGTDIAGARAFGLSAALIAPDARTRDEAARAALPPTYLLASIEA